MALPGSRDADEIDDNDREEHVDFTERFDDIIKGGAAADPWVLNVSALATVRYPWSSGFAGPPTSGTTGLGSAIGPNADGASMTVYVPIVVPKDSKLTGVKFRMQASGAGASATATVFKLMAGGATLAIGTPATVVGTLWQDANIGDVAEVATDGVSFMAFVNLTNGTGTFGRFQDFEVSLDSA